MSAGSKHTESTGLRPEEGSVVTVTVRYDKPDGTAVVFETAPGAVDPKHFQLTLDQNAMEEEFGSPEEFWASRSTVQSITMRLFGKLQHSALDKPEGTGELYRFVLMDEEQARDTKRDWSRPFAPIERDELLLPKVTAKRGGLSFTEGGQGSAGTILSEEPLDGACTDPDCTMIHEEA